MAHFHGEICDFENKKIDEKIIKKTSSIKCLPYKNSRESRLKVLHVSFRYYVNFLEEKLMLKHLIISKQHIVKKVPTSQAGRVGPDIRYIKEAFLFYAPTLIYLVVENIIDVGAKKLLSANSFHFKPHNSASLPTGCYLILHAVMKISQTSGNKIILNNYWVNVS